MPGQAGPVNNQCRWSVYAVDAVQTHCWSSTVTLWLTQSPFLTAINRKPLYIVLESNPCSSSFHIHHDSLPVDTFREDLSPYASSKSPLSGWFEQAYLVICECTSLYSLKMQQEKQNLSFTYSQLGIFCSVKKIELICLLQKNCLTDCCIL